MGHVAGGYPIATCTRAAYRVIAEYTKAAINNYGNLFVEVQQDRNFVTETPYASGNLLRRAQAAAPADLSGYADDDIVATVGLTFEVPIWTSTYHLLRVHAYYMGGADEVWLSGHATFIED